MSKPVSLEDVIGRLQEQDSESRVILELLQELKHRRGIDKPDIPVDGKLSQITDVLMLRYVVAELWRLLDQIDTQTSEISVPEQFRSQLSSVNRKACERRLYIVKTGSELHLPEQNDAKC